MLIWHERHGPVPSPFALFCHWQATAFGTKNDSDFVFCDSRVFWFFFSFRRNKNLFLEHFALSAELSNETLVKCAELSHWIESRSPRTRPLMTNSHKLLRKALYCPRNNRSEPSNFTSQLKFLFSRSQLACWLRRSSNVECELVDSTRCVCVSTFTALNASFSSLFFSFVFLFLCFVDAYNPWRNRFPNIRDRRRRRRLPCRV